MHRTILLSLCFALLVAGCSRSPPAGAPAAPAVAAAARADARAAAIRAAATRLPSVTGHRDGPAGDATWRAFFDGSELALVEESVANPPRPPLENRYYFEKGVLFYVEGQQAAEAGSGAEGAAPRVPVVAEFHGVQATRAVRVEHYGPVPLAPDRVQVIQRRAAELASAARDELSAKQVAR